jgi:hypothetical protein
VGKKRSGTFNNRKSCGIDRNFDTRNQSNESINLRRRQNFNRAQEVPEITSNKDGQNINYSSEVNYYGQMNVSGYSSHIPQMNSYNQIENTPGYSTHLSQITSHNQIENVSGYNTQNPQVYSYMSADTNIAPLSHPVQFIQYPLIKKQKGPAAGKNENT